MNQDIKRKWVEALRSGEYKQGKGALRDQDDNFCCLGVLCDLASKEGVVSVSNSYVESVYDYDGDGGESSWSELPYSVTEWAGLESENPRIDYPHAPVISLAELNDIVKATFAEIADVIEEQL